MKQFILVCLFSLSFIIPKAQTVFALVPSCKQTVKTTDSAVIFAQLVASDSVSSIGFMQISGPNVALLGNPVTIKYTPSVVTTAISVLKTIPGTYVFNVIGKSNKGTIGACLDSLVVVTPTIIPPPRTIKSFTANMVNGVLQITGVVYSDGTTQ